MGESDPDPPQRANAAQMAQRKVKAAPARRGPPGRRPGAPSTPQTLSQISAIKNSVPQFMAIPPPDAPPPTFGANNGGGLFGGAIQASSTFNFAAPNGVAMPAFSADNPDVIAMGGPEAYARWLKGESAGRESERVEDTRNPKRQFGIPATDTATNTASPTFHNVFGQSNSPFSASAGNTFGGFGVTTPASPATFGSTTTQSQPTNSAFSFGATATPNPASPSIPIDPALLGTPSNPPAATTPGGTNTWNFGPTPAPSATTGAFQFGATNTPTNPPKSPFPNVTQTSASPNDSAMSLVTSPPNTQAPTNNIFGHLAANSASPAPNAFGSVIGGSVFGSQAPSSTAAPTPPITFFGNTNGTPAPATDNISFFGNTNGTPAPVIGTFDFFPKPGNNNQTPAAKASFFPKPAEAPASPFAAKPPGQPSVATNPFPSVNKPAEASSAPTNPFPPVSKPAEQTPATSFTSKPTEQSSVNAFGGINQTPAPASTTLFATPNKPAEASSVPANPFPTFGAQPSVQANPFQNFNKPSTPLAEQNGDSKSSENAPPKNDFNFFGNAPKASSNNVFGNAPKEPSSNNVFGNTPKASSNNVFGNTPKAPSSNNIFGNTPKAPSSNNIFGNTPKAPSSNSMFGNTNSPAPSNDEPLSTLNQPLAQPTPKAKETPAAMISTTPKPNNIFKNRFGNRSTPGSDLFSNKPATPSMQQPARKAPNPEVEELLEKEEKSGGMNKGADAPEEPQVPGLNTQVAVDTYRPIEVDKKDFPRMFPGMNYASKFPIDQMQNLVPEHFTFEQEIEYYTGYRMIQLNRALVRYFSRTKATDNVFPALNYYNTLRDEILTRISADIVQAATNPKRKARNGVPQENGHVSKRVKPAQAPVPPFAPSAGLFQSQPQDQPTATAAQPQPAINGTSSQTPSLLPAPSEPRPASSSKNKRKGEELTKDDYESSQGLRPLKQARTQGSNTSQLFQNILDSPPKSPRKLLPEKGTPSSASDAKPRFNPFAKLAAPSQSPSINNPAPFSPSGGIFSPNKAPQASTTAPVKPPIFAGAPGGIFSPAKASQTSTTSTTSPVQKSDAIKPPIFAGTPGAPQSGGIKPPTFSATPVDFTSAFKKGNDDYEKKLMQKAKDEDYDSEDDDEAEWEANYWKKREETKKKIEEDGKAIQVPKFGQSKKPETRTFGQTNASNLSGTNVFGSTNPSRSSTPGAKSVFDAPAPGKPAEKNIFGHLSDSGGSAKANDAGENSDDDPEVESDSENKDPSYKYKPGEEVKSGPGTPVTPVEKTGAGIASTKKPTNPFNFGASNTGGLFGTTTATPSSPAPSSGTSTPGRSLFDRIDRDKNGNPIRSIPPPSSEEKENTQPPADVNKNIFASLNKSVGSTGDQTWKPDSPIRFGASTPTMDGTGQVPAVNVQSATPKPAHSNLFGNIKPPLTNGSSVFGGLNTTKPTGAGVGFSFGGPSAGSSLLPSVVGSTNTSRATTPGATTDGDSAVEADPDGEHHEQINLTAGGPGEEDEDVVHEIRAKAFIFVKDEYKLKGVGPLRVLKHKDTKATRMILRADPNGKVVLNKALINQAYEVIKGKTVRFTAASDDGKSFETWLLQIKTEEMAGGLAAALEAHKPS